MPNYVASCSSFMPNLTHFIFYLLDVAVMLVVLVVVPSEVLSARNDELISLFQGVYSITSDLCLIFRTYDQII
jgi:hypothetical protein